MVIGVGLAPTLFLVWQIYSLRPSLLGDTQPLAPLQRVELWSSAWKAEVLTVRRQRHWRISCTSTYHFASSSWLLVDLDAILSCCSIGVGGAHALQCREKKSRYIFIRCSITWATVSIFGETDGTQTRNPRLNMQVWLLYVSFKWYLGRELNPQPTDYGRHWVNCTPASITGVLFGN